MTMDGKTVTVRIPGELAGRLKKATDGPYAPTTTQVMVRGLELALKEIEKKRD